MAKFLKASLVPAKKEVAVLLFVVLVAVVVVVGTVVLLLILVWMPAHAPEVHSATGTSPYCSLGCDTRAGIQVLVGQGSGIR